MVDREAALADHLLDLDGRTGSIQDQPATPQSETIHLEQNMREFPTRKAFLATIGLVVATGLAGCQDQLLSNDRVASSIAGVLGASPSALTLSDRRSDGPTNTYVLAQVAGGKTYARTVNGGGVLAMGMTNPPTCQPAAESR